MTTRRELPQSGDVLTWIHSEVTDIKGRLSTLAESADQSRLIASDALESTHELRKNLSQLDGIGPVLMHMQDDLRLLRDVLARTQEDVGALRQAQVDTEGRVHEVAELQQREHNTLTRRFTDIERSIEAWKERQDQAEESSRRHLDILSQVAVRIEPLESALLETDTSHSRILSALTHVDQEIQRLSGAVLNLQNEDAAQRERVGSTAETLRRLENDIETVRVETNKISRIDDRLELVQAERSRHNERMSEVSAELNGMENRLNALTERSALIEARISGYQEDLRSLRERLRDEREQLAAYLSNLRDMETDFRKRQLVSIEKEIKDIRGRAFDVQPE